MLLCGGVACSDPPLPIERALSPAKSIVIHDVRVLDVVAGACVEHRDVRIEGDKIIAIDPTQEKVSADRVIEGAGKTLLPGLIDAHGHVDTSPEPPWAKASPKPELNLARYVYSGVTTILDPGGMDDDSFARREKIERGELLGPRIFAAGPVFTAHGGHPVPMLEDALPPIVEGYVLGHMTRQVGSEDEARSAVRALLPSKPDFIKIVIDRIPESAARLDPKIAHALIDEAKSGGVRAVAHIGTTTDAIDAGRAGVSAWIHGVYKERIPDADIEKLAAFGIPMVPTLVVFDSYATLGRATRIPSALEKELADAKLLASFDKKPDDFNAKAEMLELVERMAKERQDALDNVRRLKAAGVVILAGSDAQSAVFHGPGLHRELMLLEKAGLTPIEVIRAATLYPARFLTRSDDPPFGIAAPGKIADLILVDGDPLADLSSISKLREVIVRGVPIVRHALINER